MLTPHDNELFTRVGSGTAMGELMRLFWLPFLFADEVVADGPPVRIRLLGEDLVAFRDSGGQVGLIAERCPHRLASLYFGRNEQSGLRCIYHGWKFDVAGRCVDQPSEPARSTFKDKIRTASYPCIERAGIVWAYMGPLPAPPLPHFEWMDLAPERLVATKRLQYSNWAQALEGEFDQSHVSYIHASLDDGAPVGSALVNQIRSADTHPLFEVVATPYGSCIAAGREAPGDMRYWRITQHYMPFYSQTGPYGPNPRRLWRAWIPIDDENALVLGVMFHPLRPLTQEERDAATLRSTVSNIAPELRAPATSAPYGNYRPLATLENDFFQDREVQRTKTFSGIPEFWAQDAAAQLSMGTICDRSQEHLGTSDLAIITIRRRLLDAAKAYAAQGVRPSQVDDPECYFARGDAVLLRADEPWWEATVQRRTVTPGANPDCP
jgi:phenylpropionate dioxygenase-like ring-hydroxylating dioxygenase large terminal subunit